MCYGRVLQATSHVMDVCNCKKLNLIIIVGAFIPFPVPGCLCRNSVISALVLCNKLREQGEVSLISQS